MKNMTAYLRRCLFLVPAIILLQAFIVSAQETKCTLKQAQLPAAPELHGFHLGMTVAQAQTLVPTLVLSHTDEFGFASTSFTPELIPTLDKATYQDIRTVSLEFLDGHLTSLWIGYKDSFKWKKLDEAIAGLNKSLGLPNAWRTRTLEEQMACTDFQLGVRMVAGGPSIRIFDPAAKATLEERQAAKEEPDPHPRRFGASNFHHPPPPQPAGGSDFLSRDFLCCKSFEILI